MENELDMAHPTFVHTATFGSEEHLAPDVMEFEETEWELHYRSVLGVANPAAATAKFKNRATRNRADDRWNLVYALYRQTADCLPKRTRSHYS